LVETKARAIFLARRNARSAYSTRNSGLGKLTLSLQLFLVQFSWLLSFVCDGVSRTKLCE